MIAPGNDAGELSSQAGAFDAADTRRRVKAILLGSMGNLIEWYDVYAYSVFSLYFAGSFFPSSDPVAQQLATSVIFAAGFVARPFGGLLFGHLADTHGRRNALTWSVLLMSFGSLLIAVTPTYASIGIGAPILLTIARIVQGISQGGEYGTSATYLSEVAHPERRGFYSGVWYVTLIGGQLCATALLLFLQKLVLTPGELRSWGWRIPFFLGAALAVSTSMMRKDMHESEHFEKAKAVARNASGLEVALKHWRTMLLVVGVTIGGTSAFYTYTTYMQKFLKLSVGLTDEQTTMVVILTMVVAIVLQPLYGALSDKVGRKPLLMGFGLLGTLFTYPLLASIHRTKSAVVATLLICAAWLIVSGYTSITAILKAELFPTNVRALGVGLPYALTVSLFGGTVDSVALAFKNAGHETWFFGYATACIFVSLVVYAFMLDTKRHSRMEQHA
ncbi:MFS transporter [Polyangium sp. 6x1]|uniref:MFS transporter n=1 Tax=Polyangium sp. 6x1 TaxID=3042689 RepID=UPI002482E777|nr:MFS transporter [Polyangium sp. 6x1]MDI1449849.1 MFS transporter [Polyangium sp. 6x1]